MQQWDICETWYLSIRRGALNNVFVPGYTIVPAYGSEASGSPKSSVGRHGISSTITSMCRESEAWKKMVTNTWQPGSYGNSLTGSAPATEGGGCRTAETLSMERAGEVVME